jgi:hypothetical protein
VGILVGVLVTLKTSFSFVFFADLFGKSCYLPKLKLHPPEFVLNLIPNFQLLLQDDLFQVSSTFFLSKPLHTFNYTNQTRLSTTLLSFCFCERPNLVLLFLAALFYD